MQINGLVSVWVLRHERVKIKSAYSRIWYLNWPFLYFCEFRSISYEKSECAIHRGRWQSYLIFLFGRKLLKILNNLFEKNTLPFDLQTCRETINSSFA